MSNPYLYNPKILHQGQVFPQMTSNTEQPLFFFGASQVPENLDIPINGSGIYKPSKKLKTDKRIRTNIPISVPSIVYK